MRVVEKPEVFLVCRPQLQWDEIARYLNKKGGGAWLQREDVAHQMLCPQAEKRDGDYLVEFGGRLCYRSWAPGLNANVTRVRDKQDEYLHNVLESRHGSVTEHPNYSFVCDDVSRVFTHELVRHRAGAAYSQESMRFVRLTDISFWFPPWARKDEELMRRSVDLLHKMEEHQLWMADHFKLDDVGVPFAEKKHKTSFMRRFAPDGVATAILFTFNVRTLRHVIHMRTALSAEEEIRIVFDEVARVALREVPNLMQDYKPNEHLEWVPEFLKV